MRNRPFSAKTPITNIPIYIDDSQAECETLTQNLCHQISYGNKLS